MRTGAVLLAVAVALPTVGPASAGPAAAAPSGRAAAGVLRYSAAAPAPVPAGTLAVWVSPAGSDTADGLSPTTPVRTLQRASDLLCGSPTSCRARGVPVKVKVAQGLLPQPAAARVSALLGEAGDLGARVTTSVSTVWHYVDPAATVSIEPWSYVDGDGWSRVAATGGYPTFDGGLAVDLGMAVQPQVDLGSRGTGLQLRYLRWQGFTRGAVQLAGAATTQVTATGVTLAVPSARTVNGVTFYGCSFTRIGNWWTPARPYGYGAVLPVNASRLVIRNSHFVDLRNSLANGDGPRIHAVYLMHGSESALVEGNDLRRITGDPVRVRNGSHAVLVRGNVFTTTGAYAYVNDFYCRPTTPDTTCFPKEVRSYRGVFAGNTVNGFYPQGITGRRLVYCHDQPGGLCPPDRIAVR